jgi:exodeoxyribonuclease-3
MLHQNNIDILLLQETKVLDDQFPRDEIEDLGYNIAAYGQKTYNGVAILSKYPLEDIKRGLDDLRDDSELGSEARYIEAFTKGIRVASLYIPNGREVGHPNYFKKERFFKALCKRASMLLKTSESLVWGGDYNVAPQDNDVWDAIKWKERILCSTPERNWFRSLVNQGFYDPFAQHFTGSDKNAFTWWDYRTRAFETDSGLRIDHMLLSPQAADILCEKHVLRHTRGWDKPSDHAPVAITLDLERVTTDSL